MSLSMYQASVPVFLRALGNLRAVLQKGRAYAIDKGIEPAVLLNSRLIADMFPLTRQVQIATDMATRGSARARRRRARVLPRYRDRPRRAVRAHRPRLRGGAWLRRRADRRQRGSRHRRAAARRDPLRMDGQSYLFHFLLPNLFFHASIAYAILREPGWRWARTISSARTEAAGMDAVERRVPAPVAGILAAFMSAFVAAVVTFINTGFDAGYPRRWLLAWCLALPAAIVAAHLFRPLAWRLARAARRVG